VGQTLRVYHLDFVHVKYPHVGGADAFNAAMTPARIEISPRRWGRPMSIFPNKTRG